MLLRYGHRRLHIPLLKRCGLRNYTSENVYTNFKKLRAFPFVMTPELAQREMGRVVSGLCSNGNIWTAIMSFLFNKHAFHPIRFAAAYFPAWVVNAEIEADISYGDVRRKGSVIIRNSYLPGSHIPTLSAAPLWGPDLEGKLQLYNRIVGPEAPFPFEESMLKQHGQEVQCIPFVTSPFAILDIAKSLSWSNAAINENFKFFPSSLKNNMFSAYPVLLPLYIAVYNLERDDGTSATITTWTQAHAVWPTVMFENFLHLLDKSWGDSLTRVLRYFYNFSTSSEVITFPTPPQQVTVDMISFPATKKASKAIEEWLQKFLKSSSNISQLSSNIENDLDPRIRPMTEDEKSALDRYFRIEKEILLTKRVMADLENAGPNAKAIAISLGGQSPTGGTTPEAASVVLQARLDELNAKKEEVTPTWWTEWELSKEDSS